MEKRKLSAKEILADIKAGMSNSDLIAKYELRNNQLEKVFEKLSAAGLLVQSEIQNRRKPEPQTTSQTLFKCPACGKPQTRELEECPDCGVIISKYKAKPAMPQLQKRIVVDKSEENIEKAKISKDAPENARTTKVENGTSQQHLIWRCLLFIGLGYWLYIVVTTFPESMQIRGQRIGYYLLVILYNVALILGTIWGMYRVTKGTVTDWWYALPINCVLWLLLMPEVIREMGHASSFALSSTAWVIMVGIRFLVLSALFTVSLGIIYLVTHLIRGRNLLKTIVFQPSKRSSHRSRIWSIILFSVTFLFLLGLVADAIIFQNLTLFRVFSFLFLLFLGAGSVSLLLYLRIQSGGAETHISALPDSFLELTGPYRKEALGLAWESILEKGLSQGIQKGSELGQQFGVGVLGLISIAFFLRYLNHLVNIIKKLPDYSSFMTPDRMWIEYWSDYRDDVVYGLLTCSLALFFIYLCSYLHVRVSKRRKENLQIGPREGKLRELATAFIEEQYPQWCGNARDIAVSQAQSQLNLVPESIYVFGTFLQNSPLSSKTQNMTVAFSNGYLSIISNIVWDLHGTSYSLVDKNDPTYEFSAPTTWSTEEFHYQDVVEVTYKPSPQSVTEMESLSTAAVKQKLARMKARSLSRNPLDFPTLVAPTATPWHAVACLLLCCHTDPPRRDFASIPLGMSPNSLHVSPKRAQFSHSPRHFSKA